MTITNVAIIGLGLLGGSIGLAVSEHAPQIVTTGFDRDEDTQHLGEALKLPSQHEHLRARLERQLEPLGA